MAFKLYKKQLKVWKRNLGIESYVRSTSKRKQLGCLQKTCTAGSSPHGWSRNQSLHQSLHAKRNQTSCPLSLWSSWQHSEEGKNCRANREGNRSQKKKEEQVRKMERAHASRASSLHSVELALWPIHLRRNARSNTSAINVWKLSNSNKETYLHLDSPQSPNGLIQKVERP